jgi:hypothetical protein
LTPYLAKSSSRYESRNFRLGVLHGALAELGKTLANPSLVLALFVRQLGGSNTLVGLLSTIHYSGWFLPQLFVAGRIQNEPHKTPYYMKAELTRSAGYAIIALAILAMPQAGLLAVFFVLFAVSYLAHGAGSVPKFDVISKAIPAPRRGSFFARSNLWAGVVSFGAGLVVRYILNEEPGPPPVERYAWLILLAAVFFALAVVAFWVIAEPVIQSDCGQISWARQLRHVPALLSHNAGYRRLVGTLVLMTVGQRLADSFYIVYATEVLDVPVAMAGFYLSTLVFSGIFSNLLWDRLSCRRESRVTIQLSAAAALAAPGAALLIGALAAPAASVLPSGSTLPGYAFMLVFLLMGVRDSGKHIGKRSVLLDIVPVAERPIYWGLLNTILGIVSLLPMLAGTMIDWLGFQPLFGLVAGLTLMGWLSSQRLGETVGLAV